MAARNQGHPTTSWYAQTANPFPVLPLLKGHHQTEVCIIGAGYTGLGAALCLAEQSVPTIVLEEAQVGSGASGRNGGQIHTGQRRDQYWLEKTVGPDDAMALWTLAQDAKAHLQGLITQYAIACDLKPGMIEARHRPTGEDHDRAWRDHMAERYGYDQIRLIDRDALAHELGCETYFGGTVDEGGGHLHPLNFALGLGHAALNTGVQIFERSRALSWRKTAQGMEVTTPQGTVTCQRLILTGDGYIDGLSPTIDAQVMPINNFILATAPLGELADEIIRSDAAVADSRFVVNYFRKSPDGRLLFGGGENYSPWFPSDLSGFVRRHMLKVYPRLADVPITHAWGGTLGITMNRAPYVRALAPGVVTAAGYSGQGVMLAPYFGKLLADATLGEMSGLDLLSRLPAPPFPGGKFLRWPALVAGLSWYALRDRL
jgi:gamma-glutamylputrescine oxidase